MMEIGLTLGATPPPRRPWWPHGAVVAADFAHNRYMRAGQPAAPGGVFAFARASGALMADASGIHRAFPPHALRRLHGLGALVEPAAVNLQRSADMAGAGPGILPAGWALDASGTETEVLATGVEAGLPVIDLRIHGTPWAPFYNLLMSPAGDTPAAPDQSWVCSFFVRRIGGSMAGIETARVVLYERDAAGEFLRGSETHFTPAGALQRVGAPRTLDHPGVVNLNAGLGLAVTPETPFDITLRLAAPQLERDRMTSPILTGTGITGARAADSLVFPAGGTHDWTVVFDDFSEQVFGGVAGDFSPDPAGLDRPLLRMVFAHPA